jgi:hypothetical protein
MIAAFHKIHLQGEKDMAHDFIPSNDTEFDLFFKNICQYVNAKCTNTPPVWTR